MFKPRKKNEVENAKSLEGVESSASRDPQLPLNRNLYQYACRNRAATDHESPSGMDRERLPGQNRYNRYRRDWLTGYILYVWTI